LSVVVFEVITVAITVGVVPLRCIIREGVCEARGVSNPKFGWVGKAVSVHVPTTKAVEPTDPARVHFFWRRFHADIAFESS
jgi:hypothetical protein